MLSKAKTTIFLLLVGVFMTLQTHVAINLENFDDAWSLGDPIAIEQKFRKLLPGAEALSDKSIYLQILSQIALTLAMQKHFDSAHKILDDAEILLKPEYVLAQVRILLERGRVYQQAERLTEARAFFEKAYELSLQHKFDFHTINAAHMIAIVAQTPEEKIAWNQRAIDMTEKTSDERARAWSGSLYNNIGQNYLETKQFDKALVAFEKALACRKKEGYAPNIRVARWAIASTFRLLNRLDEALAMLNPLLEEYDAITSRGNLDMPAEMFTLIRGWVYEELAEIYWVQANYAKAQIFATLAYDDLSKNEMFVSTAPERLKRLKELSANNKTADAWLSYLKTVTHWKDLVQGVIPRETGCGLVYELANPIECPHESFAIVDMHNMKTSKPHYHINGETEIYIILQGSGIVVVGGKEQAMQKGSVIVTPPNTAHFIAQAKYLVLAVINTPPFKPENSVDVTTTNSAVGFDEAQFKRLSKDA